MGPTYRADIDGLRAIAVLSVLLFHAGVETFSGGFVGVDIFFVISGYLITMIIHRELEAGCFSIARFYERRFRRILPAAVVMVLATLVAGSLLYHSEEFTDLARSAAATGVFASNIHFYLQSGYFADPAESMPLLHTWSLAVEEQFYLLFPPIMILVAKLGRRSYAAGLLLLTVLSFAACVLATPTHTSAAFYLSPMRAWELLVGGLLAVDVLPGIRRQRVRDVASLAGVAMLTVSFLQFSELTLFPGFAALLPVVGTAMIIHAGANGESLAGRWLKCRPLVFTGLISYSLYLWHWPIIVFTRYYSVVPLSPVATTAILAATFALAVLSWRYVEMPFRDKRAAPQPRQLFGLSAAATVLVTAVAGAILWTGGLPGRYAHEAVLQTGNDDAEWQHWGRCERRMIQGDPELCGLGNGDREPSFILWGDSHARSMATSVSRSAARHGLAGEIAIQGGCPPLLQVVYRHRRQCDAFNDAVIERIASREHLTTVILASRWALPVHGRYDMRRHAEVVPLVDLARPIAGETDNARVFESGLRRTIERLNGLGRRVILVGPLPEIGYDVPSATFVALMTHRDVESMIAPSLSEHETRNREIALIFEAVQGELAVSRIVNPADYLCDAESCMVTIDNRPLYRDDNHLSAFGASVLGSMFDSVFGAIAADDAAAGQGPFAWSPSREIPEMGAEPR